jgi:gliding motility-associated-like protein
MYNCSDRFATYQIVLQESDSSITMHLIDKPACTANLANRGTQGLNYDNTTGIAVPGRNNTSWVASNESWQFTPDGAGDYALQQIDFAPEPVSPEEKIVFTWYEQTYPGGDQISSAWEVIVSPKETTTYYCEVSLCGNMRLVDDVQVTAIPVPNAFHPNSAAEENRVFKVYADPENRVTKFALYIYNRWGELVFETTDINEGWDGTSNGNPCNAGVYVWTVYYEGVEGESTNRGTVTLVR